MTLSILKSLFAPGRIWATLVVLAFMAFFARLGIWQIDRYQEKQETARFMASQYQMAEVDLATDPIPADLSGWHYRRVILNGEWDYANQVVWRGQSLDGELGGRLLTPLRLTDGRAVLADRGWIPYVEAQDAESWAQLNESVGEATIQAILLPSQPLPPDLLPPTESVNWVQPDVAAIDARLPYDLLPLYAQLRPGPQDDPTALPIREDLYVELSAGTHLSYAVQWFTFALTLGFAYYMFFRVRALRASRVSSQ